MTAHMGGGVVIVMMIGMVVFWGAVILGVVWVARGSFGRPGVGASPDARWETALEILERRFAEGEISAEEYRERREVITRGTPNR